MKIDEAAFERLFGGHSASNQMIARAYIETYLAALPALPSAEPGRDRIAVSRFHDGTMAVAPVVGSPAAHDWGAMEDWVDIELGQAARYIVRANCPPPAELVPVEVEGSVEAVG